MKKKKTDMTAAAVSAALWIFWLLAGRPIGVLLPILGTALAFSAAGSRKRKEGREEGREEETAEQGFEEPLREETRPEVQPSAADYGTEDPELVPILREGKLALNELGRLYALNPSERVRSLVMQIMELTNGMVEDGRKDRNDLPLIRKYLNVGLPVSIRILQEYDSRGEEKTVALLEQLLAGFRNQYDELFENDALDIENEIAAMEAKINLDGLKPSDFGGT